MLVCDRCDRRNNVEKADIQMAVALHSESGKALNYSTTDLCRYCREEHAAMLAKFIQPLPRCAVAL